MTGTQFLVDECCPVALVAELRKLEFDVRYVAEDASGVADADVLALATRDDRVLVTTDKDFGLLVLRLRRSVPGLVLLRTPQLGTRSVAQRVAGMIQENADQLAGRITTFTKDRIRRRPLLRTPA